MQLLTPCGNQAVRRYEQSLPNPNDGFGLNRIFLVKIRASARVQPAVFAQKKASRNVGGIEGE